MYVLTKDDKVLLGATGLPKVSESLNPSEDCCCPGCFTDSFFESLDDSTLLPGIALFLTENDGVNGEMQATFEDGDLVLTPLTPARPHQGALTACIARSKFIGRWAMGLKTEFTLGGTGEGYQELTFGTNDRRFFIRNLDDGGFLKDGWYASRSGEVADNEVLTPSAMAATVELIVYGEDETYDGYEVWIDEVLEYSFFWAGPDAAREIPFDTGEFAGVMPIGLSTNVGPDTTTAFAYWWLTITYL